MSESWNHSSRVSAPFSRHFSAGANSSALGNRSFPTPALTSCSSFGSENAAGLAASAPPAGDTVLRGTPLRQRTLQTPKIPPLQSHSLVWQPALGRVTHTTKSFADLSLKWARGTSWARDLEKMGCVSIWQVESSGDCAEDKLPIQGLTPYKQCRLWRRRK